ncbi:MAG: RIP metalloprotease RseP [Candidatus Falkowbacteria bacterium]
MFITIITFFVVLSLLVFVHEMGHFWVARKLGVKAEEFGFGFPPRAWGIYKNKSGRWATVRGNKEVEDAADTVYSINAIPMGGFVKIKGEDGENKEERDSFAGRSALERAAILLAGVSMNIVLAAVLISLGFMIGLPQALDGVGPNAAISARKIQIIEVAPDSPAAAALVEAGDVIAGINGLSFAASDNLQQYINERAGDNLRFSFERGDSRFDKEIVPEVREETGKGGIGIVIGDTGIVRYPFFTAIWEGVKTTVLLTWAIIAAFYNLLAGLIMGRGLGGELGGPVRIAQITGDAARMGLAYLINFTALLSINLAIINAFPFPALDGGRLLFLAIEKIKGSPVKKEVEGTIHYIGFALLMLLVLLVTYKDIARIWQGG